METSVENIDTEQLICSIEKQPSLWDSSHKDYSDRGVKKNAWEAVIKEFIVDFDNKTTMVRKEIGAAIQRKWKHLRDPFTREIAKKKQDARSGSGSSARKVYIYFDQLNFLQTAIKSTSSSLDDSEGQSTNRVVLGADHDLSQETQGQDVPEVETPSTKRKKNNKKTSLTESDDLLLETLKSQYLLKQQEVNDEDRLFMLSLVPELKKLPDYLRLEVKSSIMSIVLKARMQAMNQPQYTPMHNAGSYPNHHHYNSYQQDLAPHAPPIHQLSTWTPAFHPSSSGQQQSCTTQAIVHNVERSATPGPGTICASVSQPQRNGQETPLTSPTSSAESELFEF